MTEMPVLFTSLLCLMTACLVAVTIAFLFMSYDIRRMVRRIETLIPHASRAVKQANVVMRILGRMAQRLDAAAGSAEAVIAKLCGSVNETLEQFQAIKMKAQRSFGKWMGSNGSNGHGTRADSRSRHNRS